jgi:preprotein translocase subunit SecE
VNGKVEGHASRLDSIKLAAAVLLLVSAVVGFYYYADQPLILRVLGIMLAAGAALAVALQTEMGRQGYNFVLEARDEVRKVVWPTRKETVQTTMIIIATVLLVAIFLWIIDIFLLWAVRLMTGQGG